MLRILQVGVGGYGATWLTDGTGGPGAGHLCRPR